MLEILVFIYRPEVSGCQNVFTSNPYVYIFLTKFSRLFPTLRIAPVSLLFLLHTFYCATEILICS